MLVGFIVNPVAGLGGPPGLRGSDGGRASAALAAGSLPTAGRRAEAAVRSVMSSYAEEGIEPPEIITCGGEMGENVLRRCAYGRFRVVYSPDAQSRPEDTTKAASAMKVEGAAILIFAGGDGTARDIAAGAGEGMPVLGIPAGVKMYTGAFLYRPAELGNAMLELEGGIVGRKTDILDFANAGTAMESGVAVYGSISVPALASVQPGKSEEMLPGDEIEGIAAYIVEHLLPDDYYIMGTGSTVKGVLRALGHSTHPMGVDLLKGRVLVAEDAGERELSEQLKGVPPERIHLVVTPLGGNGFILGRGNQQISPPLIERIPRRNITIVSTSGKLRRAGTLHVDTGSNPADRSLRGVAEVLTGYAYWKVCEVS